MAAFVLERAPVTSGLLAMVRTYLVDRGTGSTDLRIEAGHAPNDSDLNRNEDGRLVDPYAVLYDLPSPVLYGDLAYPESGARLTYQITSVGRTDESARIMADLIRRCILERSAGGGFVRAITAGSSMTVTGRWQRELGMMVPEAGLWNVHDQFDLEVQAHG